MAGPFDFLHIKGRTAGSSNELSFDVLDAARHEMDERRRAIRPRRPPLTPKLSQGSYTGVAGTATLSGAVEVERRKKERRTHIIRARVLIVLVVVALAAGGGFAGYRLYQNTVDFTTRFNILIHRIMEVDHTLVQVDALMTDPLNSVEQAAREETAARFADLENELSSVVQDARQMTDDAMNGSDSTALLQVETAASARIDMLEASAAVFELSATANRNADAATEAWNKVLAGDADARDAAQQANAATTEEATMKAREQTEQAIASMKEARDELELIAQHVSGLSFSTEFAYIDKRLESLEAAVETSNALLANDRAGAQTANDAYNAADSEAATLAIALPLSIGDQVKTRYANAASSKEEAYIAARTTASSADSALRAYL